jgi:hypothetical protein
LADRFQEARLALNDISQRVFFIGDTEFSLGNLLESN